MRRFVSTVLTSLTLVSTTAFAGPSAGQLGLGTGDVGTTPIGIRYWASQQVGIDLEAGFQINDTTPNADPNQVSSVVDLMFGIPINVWECSDVWLHVKPFAALNLVSYEDYVTGSTTTAGESLTNVRFGASLEMEAWILECLSFSVSHGVAVMVNDGGDAGDSTTDFGSFGNSLGSAGFHLYF